MHTTSEEHAIASTPRTLDELWDLLNTRGLFDKGYSIEDAVFLSEAEKLQFWATLERECTCPDVCDRWSS
jgi:hypothetical protein